MTLGLSDAELADIRADIAQLLPDTCVIMSKQSTPDGMGGQSVTWTAAGTVDCRLDRRTGREVLAGGAIRPYSEWVLTVPHNASINTTQRVEHGGITYNVTAVNSDKSWRDCIRASVEALP